MTKADIDGVTVVDHRCFSVPWSKKSFQDETENELAVYFTAKDGVECIGYGGFWNISGEGDITNIAVIPEYRKKGVATLILTEMIKRARELEIKRFTLEVRKSNYAARSLYKKFGFVNVGERKNYYSDNREDAVIMRLDFE